MFADLKYVQSLKKEVDELQTDKTELSKEYDLLLQECVSKDIMCSILRSFDSLDEKTELQCLYLEKYQECEDLKTELSKRNENVENKSFNELSKKFAELERHCISLELSLQHKNEVFQNNRPCKNQDAHKFPEFFKVNKLKAQLQEKNTVICELKKLIAKLKGKSVDTMFEKPSVVRQPNAFRFQKPSVLGLIHRTSVSRPQLRSNQMKDKVVQNNSQVKIKQNEVEYHHRISSFSNKTKFVTACNDSLMSRTINVKVVCVACGKCVFNSNHDACVSKFISDVNTRTNKPKVEPISARKPTRKANQSVATPHKKTVASGSTIQKSRSYFRMLYANTSKAWTWWIEKQCPSGYKWMPKIKKKWLHPRIHQIHWTDQGDGRSMSRMYDSPETDLNFKRQPREEKKSFRQKDEKKGKSDRKCFRCGDPNHLIGNCPKPSRNKDQKAFIGGSWSNSENDDEDKTNDETCLMA
ncbi:retrovirus-related pol polyprotein from transposon TNT 1-94 [Tanacetum coccineum]